MPCNRLHPYVPLKNKEKKRETKVTLIGASQGIVRDVRTWSIKTPKCRVQYKKIAGGYNVVVEGVEIAKKKYAECLS